MNNETRRVMFSSMRGDWRTPKEIFDQLDAEFHFTLDPCADPGRALKNTIHTFVQLDGLGECWEAYTVFMNPPYGRDIVQWVAKAAHEADRCGVTTCALLPARTDTAWFWDHCIDREIQTDPRSVEIRSQRTDRIQESSLSAISVDDRRLPTGSFLSPHPERF